MSSGGLASVELYDTRFDWVVAALLAIPLVWLFYGFDAAFVCLLVFVLIGALKPLISHVGSRMAAGLFAAGAILLVSPVLRYVFYNGFCYDGAWSVAAGINRYQVPDLCQRGLLSNVGQELWVGPLRDVVMPLAGVGLIMLAWLDQTKHPRQLGCGKYTPADAANHKRISWLTRWSGVIVAIILWAGVTALNYRVERIAIETRHRAESEERAREAAIAAEEARKIAADQAAEKRRIAAETAAKQVQPDWLIGNWVNVERMSASDRTRIVFCETDNALQIKSGAKFEQFDESGMFELSGSNIRFFNRTRQEYGEPDSAIEKLSDATYSIERSGIFIKLDGETHARCRST